MIVYRDIISGDEMLSDAFKLVPVVDDEGATVEGLMQVESKNISKSDDVDVGCGNAFGGDAEEDAGGSAGPQTVNNVIDGFSYTETQIGAPADFKAWIKEYMNAVVLKHRELGTPKEEIQAFKATAPNIAKFFLKKFSDVQFYLGASFNAETMVFSIYPDGALTPNFYFISRFCLPSSIPPFLPPSLSSLLLASLTPPLLSSLLPFFSVWPQGREVLE